MSLRFPVKFNRASLPAPLHRLLPCEEDPRPLVAGASLSRQAFANIISSIRIGGTWKTTQSARHLLSDAVIAELAEPGAVILDVAASDGITSLDLIETIGDRFGRYFVTDAFCRIYTQIEGNTVNFYDRKGQCLLRAIGPLLFYAETAAGRFPFKQIADAVIARAPRFNAARATQLDLFQPDLLRLAAVDLRVALREWSILDPWPEVPADIAKVANLLNRSYFTDDQIRTALSHLRHALKPDGWLLLVENRTVEQWSLFANTPKGFRLEREGNSGSDIASLLTD